MTARGLGLLEPCLLGLQTPDQEKKPTHNKARTRKQYSAPPTELSSLLEAGHFVDLYYTSRNEGMELKYAIFMYLNCR